MSSNPSSILQTPTSVLIQPKNSLDEHIKINTVKNEIVTHIQSIPNYQILKNDVELIEYVSSKIINLIKVKDYNLSEIVLDIFCISFSLSDLERDCLKKVIEYLLKNKVIKKISKIKKYSNNVFSLIKKKIF